MQSLKTPISIDVVKSALINFQWLWSPKFGKGAFVLNCNNTHKTKSNNNSLFSVSKGQRRLSITF